LNQLRIGIVETLWASPLQNVTDLMVRFNKEQPVISQELKFLRNEGIVDYEKKKSAKRGRFHFYFLTQEAIRRIELIHAEFGGK